MRILQIIILFFFITTSSFSQVLIGSETISSINADAALELNNTDKGLLINRIELTTTTSASPLNSHVSGMVVYNTATANDVSPGMYYNNGTKWIKIDSSFGSDLYGLNVRHFGAVGDNTTDDTLAFQKALDSAKVVGNRVIVPVGNYKITSTLKIEDGVILTGEGTGSTPLQTPYNGSSIRYSGAGFALQILGHNAGIRDLLIYDANQGASNASGIQVLGDGEIVESLRLFNVLILYFVNGTGLELMSANSGGVTYGTYYNIRVRHAKTGIRITQDASSFTNSNVFHHGAISGGGFDYGLLVESGNNNQFYGTIIEPPSSNFGHLVVNEGAEIQATNIRIEGNSQNATDPLLHFKSGSMNSNISGTFAGGLVVNEGNNRIGFRSGKSALYEDSGENLYENTSFYGLHGTNLPFWDITGPGVVYETQTPDLFSNHNVLKITVPSGVTANLEQTLLNAPKISNDGSYNQMTMGMFVKTSQASNTYIRTNSPNGVTVSQSHPGDNKWHFISMANLVDTSTDLDTKLEIANSSGGSQEVYITAPTFTFGYKSPKITSKPIRSSGGILTGTISNGVYYYTPTSNYIALPKEGNIFFINGTQTVARINHNSADFFPKGTLLTLVFENAGLTITDGVYINLKSGFTSTVNSSLQILSLGNGTWIEINRNL